MKNTLTIIVGIALFVAGQAYGSSDQKQPFEVICTWQIPRLGLEEVVQ